MSVSKGRDVKADFYAYYYCCCYHCYYYCYYLYFMCIIYTLDCKYPLRPLSSARVVYALNHCSVILIPFMLSLRL